MALELGSVGLSEWVTQREFDDFRDTTRDDLRFLRNLLLGTLGAAILSGLFSSVFVIIRGAG